MNPSFFQGPYAQATGGPFQLPGNQVHGLRGRVNVTYVLGMVVRRAEIRNFIRHLYKLSEETFESPGKDGAPCPL